MPALKHDTADYQRAVDTFVSREVVYCVSYLVSEIMQKDQDCEWHHMSQRQPDRDDCEDQGIEFREEDETLWYIRQAGQKHWNDEEYDDEDEAIAGAVSEYDVEGSEVFEHWIVSDFLARKLAERGEVIERDFYGLTIWGRATTGQAISIDSVICQIYDALHAND